MTEQGVKRKLAAILSADAVGYSRLMGSDEKATLTTLKAHRGLMGGLIRQHGGRVVDAVGDNLLAEFPSVVDAVACAVASQCELAKRDADLPPDRQMPFRIGIHLGDVMFEGEQVYGDGVNIAARIEALAEPGGIIISEAVHDQVRRKLPLVLEDLGEQTLKNIADPVRVYRVNDMPGAGGGGASEFTVPGFSGRPAIAVLAFDNLSNDPEQEYFADGIAEDLITRLSAFRRFPVIARNSSFTYKGKPVDVKRVSRDLGVRYVVEGSVRKGGQRVRVSAQLIDATTGHHVWSEHYDRDLGDVIALQDEISERIAASMSPGLLAFERDRSLRRPPQSPDAWDCILRGNDHLWRLSSDDNLKARSYFEKAAKLDFGSAEAFSGVALTHALAASYGWAETPAEELSAASNAARQSIELDDRDPAAQLALAMVCMVTGQRDNMLAAVDAALLANPSFAFGYGFASVLQGLAGLGDEATASAEKAIRLSPHDPYMWWFHHGLGTGHFAACRYADAATWERKSIRRNPSAPYSQLTLATSCAHLGLLDEAREAVAEGRRLQPGVSLSDMRASWAAADADFLDRYLEGLRKAGWTEDDSRPKR